MDATHKARSMPLGRYAIKAWAATIRRGKQGTGEIGRDFGLEGKTGFIELPLSIPFLVFPAVVTLGSRELAARLGLEPRQTESESVVLPLHYRAESSGGPSRARRSRFAMRAATRPSREMPPGVTKLEPAMGFEPATACLQNRCSAVELRRRARRPETKVNSNNIRPAQSIGRERTAGGSPGTRTPNLLIKSQLLYQLS
jgi:hypothetical protein